MEKIIILLLISLSTQINSVYASPLDTLKAMGKGNTPLYTPSKSWIEQIVATDSGCVGVDNDGECTNNLKDSKEAEVKAALVEQIGALSEEVVQKKTAECNLETNEYMNNCQSWQIDEIKEQVEKLQQNLSDKIDKIQNSTPEELNTDNSSSDKGTQLERILASLKDVKKQLTEKQSDLKEKIKSCNQIVENVEQVCVEPELARSDLGGASEKTEVTPLDIKLKLEAKAEMAVNTVTIPAPQIVAKAESTSSSFAAFSVSSTPVEETINLSINQAREAIVTLSTFASQTQGSECTGFCPEKSSTTEIEAVDPRASTLPYSMGVPVDEPAGGAVAKTTGGNTGGGVSGDQVMADAQNGAYGPSGSGSAGSTGGAAGAGGSAQGGIGNAMAGLSGLSSMFGKTSGGGFGNDSSYGSNRSGARYNSNSGGNANYALPTDNTYTSNRNAQGSNQPLALAQRAFGGNPSNSDYGTTPGANGGGGSSLGGSNSNSNLNNNKPKSLLSRIFGKKDKTFLGKNVNGSGGGYGSSSSSRKSGSGSYEKDGLNNNDTYQKANGRSFDPSKYAPSKAAEDRAYARATGRKIASHSSGNTDGATVWPNDISRDKRRNMFSKVSVVHKMNLDLNK